MSEYDGKQFVGIDLHRRWWVIVRQTVLVLHGFHRACLSWRRNSPST